jgi:glucan phosphoethanolaminetransferase (alkaline phosphatase superfamily)
MNNPLPTFRLRFNLGYFCLALIIFFIEIAIAKYMHGWVRSYLGDVLVIVLLYSAIMSVAALNKKSVVLFTLIVAFAIEFGQYFKLAERLGFAPDSVAYIVLGNTFSGADLGCYAIGAILILLVEQVNWQRGH